MSNYTVSFGEFMDLLKLPNQFTDNLFWPFILMILWLIIFIGLSNKGNSKGLSISFFIILLLSMLLNWAGLVSNLLIGICFIGFLISFFLIRKGED